MKTFLRDNQLERTIHDTKRNQSIVFNDNRTQSSQFNKLRSNIQDNTATLQLARPGFSSNIKKGAADIRKKIRKAFDLAHRLSFRDIELFVWQNQRNPKKIYKLIHALTVPRRDYGIFKKGYRGYYDKVIIEARRNIYKAIRMLNSSPFNLRPGDPSLNRSIGAAPDLHHEDNDPARPLTPQSAALEPFARDPDPGKSSDFLTGAAAKGAEETLTKRCK